MGGLGLDVVGEVVGKVAREDDAARDGLLLAGGPHLLDVVLVIGVDDGRDVKVGDAIPRVEGNLAQHAGDDGLTISDGEPVSLPAVSDLDRHVLSTGNLGVWDLGHVGVAGEVDCAVKVVLGHKGDRVGSVGGNCGRQERDELGELHIGSGNVWLVGV